jgi:hypothetical protein
MNATMWKNARANRWHYHAARILSKIIPHTSKWPVKWQR